MKKTAVTTLLIRMFGDNWPNNKNFNDMVGEVLELEKQQIAEAYRVGVEEDVYNSPLTTGEEYYKRTYEK
jgi:hypothetical protein